MSTRYLDSLDVIEPRLVDPETALHLRSLTLSKGPARVDALAESNVAGNAIATNCRGHNLSRSLIFGI